MEKPRCIICDNIIEKPKVGVLHCSKKKCVDEFNKNMIELWKAKKSGKIQENSESIDILSIMQKPKSL